MLVLDGSLKLEKFGRQRLEITEGISINDSNYTLSMKEIDNRFLMELTVNTLYMYYQLVKEYPSESFRDYPDNGLYHVVKIYIEKNN